MFHFQIIKPIFRDLAKPDLRRQCLHRNTQNPNESVNSVIWTLVPKLYILKTKPAFPLSQWSSRSTTGCLDFVPMGSLDACPLPLISCEGFALDKLPRGDGHFKCYCYVGADSSVEREIASYTIEIRRIPLRFGCLSF
ncbi:hypothetical protein CEXT_536071 [Caerostris extrusa]|uniref:Uncharacterized protein n=1 Tax=Caerostris extrusa TaxID=172846 RepID=A0AAV4Q316_CAEEX|nr:hypothetical protein CEXT_536071 [Caerostris extrusa]